MTVFVINEWLWEDSSGRNSLQAQKEAFVVVTKLAASVDQIVVIEGSPFDQKFWHLCKSTSTVVLRIVKAYLLTVRQNLDRCLLLKPDEVCALPNELASAIKADDHYLVRAQLTMPGAILVTTDTPLREAVRNAGLNSLSREEFLHTYR